MTWIERYAADERDSRLLAGLDYFAGEYSDLLEGTVYEKWEDAGIVVPMRWERVSSDVVDVFVTVYRGMGDRSGSFLRDLRESLFHPSGWTIEQTTPGEWKSIDGEKFSEIRMELEKGDSRERWL